MHPQQLWHLSIHLSESSKPTKPRTQRITNQDPETDTDLAKMHAPRNQESRNSHNPTPQPKLPNQEASRTWRRAAAGEKDAAAARECAMLALSDRGAAAGQRERLALLVMLAGVGR